jgi:hypothetical protein
MTVLHIGVLIAGFRRDAPAHGGAFADERRIVTGDTGGRVYRFGRATLVAPFAAGVAWWYVACQRFRRSIRFASLALERITPSPRRRAPRHLIVAPPPRAAARSSGCCSRLVRLALER